MPIVTVLIKDTYEYQSLLNILEKMEITTNNSLKNFNEDKCSLLIIDEHNFQNNKLAIKELKIPIILSIILGKEHIIDSVINDYIYTPYDNNIVNMRVKNYIRLEEYRKQLLSYSEDLEKEVSIKTLELQKSLEHSKAAEYQALVLLGKVSEYRDDTTGKHSNRMSEYSALLSQLIGLDAKVIDLVKKASILHDIGKVGISDKILKKPGPLTKDEYINMKEHVNIGCQILETTIDSELFDIAKLIASQHHEKDDGTGYPKGLKGNKISVYGQICAITDCYDALSSKRPYKEEMHLSEILEIMDDEPFNKKVYKVFRNHINRFELLKKALN